MSAAAPATGTAPFLRLEGIVKRYGALNAVDDVSLTIEQGEVFCLLGESGSGKSTLLRTLAGFVVPDEGRVVLEGADITQWPPYRRPVNMMFQSYALFPHLTVAGNVRFGLEREGLAKEEIARRLDEVLPLLRLEQLAARRPHQLSGGQQQRVALARCLVKRPRLLLLDEPLAALDRKLRESTQFELLRLQAQLGITFVIVTHDQDEAMTMAHRIAVMRHGRLEQIGAPREVYERPNSRFVADFVGSVNLIEGRVSGRRDQLVRVVSEDWGGDILVDPAGADALAEDQAVTVAVRPERLRFLSLADPVDETFNNAQDATVEQCLFRGDQYAYVVRTDRRTLHVTLPAGQLQGAAPAAGQRVRVAFAPGDGVLLTR